jgi:hypothetical protein
MPDILDEAQSVLQCKTCPWYKTCVLPMRFTEEDLKNNWNLHRVLQVQPAPVCSKCWLEWLLQHRTLYSRVALFSLAGFGRAPN